MCKLLVVAKQLIIGFLVAITSTTAIGQAFDANGKIIDKSVIRYQWNDPKTGKTVIRDYPPVNLQVQKIGQRQEGNDTIILLDAKPPEKDLGPPVGAKQITLDVESDQVKEQIASRCFEALKNGLGFFDRDSVRIEGPALHTFKGGKPQVWLSLNAKNRYGGYVGSKSYYCIFSTDGQRILEAKAL